MIAFPNKLGAMMVVVPWGVGTFTTDFPELKLGYMLSPVYRGGTRSHADPHWGTWMLSKKLEGDKKNAALLFLKEIVENPAFLDIPLSKNCWVGGISNKFYIDNI